MSTLADLRRQNIAEQKGEDPRTSADTEASTSALPQASNEPPAPNEQSASTEVRTHASTEASKEASTGARKPARAQVSKQAGKQVSEEGSAQSLTERVREALAENRNHPGGIKATVDMSPELSKRAKKYCLEHDVSSMRVLCLELLDAFLTEEGF